MRRYFDWLIPLLILMAALVEGVALIAVVFCLVLSFVA